MDLHVNGVRHTTAADPERSLLSLLRDDLDLTGTKYGCGEGQCGACTVLLDDRPVRSCQVRLPACAGCRVRTIEGLAGDGDLHPVQQAFIDEGAMQCGYCTPGMIVSAVALLEGDPRPAEERIVDHLQGNVCRCGTYRRVLAAVRRAATAMREGGR